jgi:hypothetical protein
MQSIDCNIPWCHQSISDLHIYQLSYGIEILVLGKLMWYQ